MLKFNVGGDGDYVTVNVTVNIPDGYPENGTLDISAALAVDSHCDKESRKAIELAIPRLTKVYQWEAHGCEGGEALLSVFSVADEWVQTAWNAVHAKQFEACTDSATVSSGGIETCRMLVYTHHIVQAERFILCGRRRRRTI